MEKDNGNLLDDLLIILVLYKTELGKSASFNTLINSIHIDQKLNFFIYDNSPVPLNSENFNIEQANINYVHDQSNSGVSKAYNDGVGYAKFKGYKWVMLADQDTSFSEDIFVEFQKSVLQNKEVELFTPMLMSNGKVLSPCSFFLNRGRALDSVKVGLHHFSGLSLLNSGMLMSVKSFDAVGGFNEEIRLDFADFYFINKYKKKYNSFYVINSKAQHDLSSTETDIEKVLIRFKFYCNGARNYSENLFTFVVVFVLVMLRSFKLCLKHKKLVFFKYFYLFFIGKKKLFPINI